MGNITEKDTIKLCVNCKHHRIYLGKHSCYRNYSEEIVSYLDLVTGNVVSKSGIDKHTILECRSERIQKTNIEFCSEEGFYYEKRRGIFSKIMSVILWNKL